MKKRKIFKKFLNRYAIIRYIKTERCCDSVDSKERNEKEQLQQENIRLRSLAMKDWLTGLYNRTAMEEQVNKSLHLAQMGSIIVIDIDNFTKFNDLYGHLIGDQVLEEIGKILTFYFSKKDIIGRIDGDEFVVFLAEEYTDHQMEEKLSKLKKRFQAIGNKYRKFRHLTVTAASARYRPNDDYRSLFDRADQKLLMEKRKLHMEKEGKKYSINDGKSGGQVVDMKNIQKELSETEPARGAFCQNYDEFKNVYRFVKRGLKRSGRSVFTILITLTDKNGDFIPLSIREEQMDLLAEVIHYGLRVGDAFTQYSSCQFLLMVLDVSCQNAEEIGRRIAEEFLKLDKVSGDVYLQFSVYPIDEE